MHLIIMRHAKSSWSNPGQTDFDRGLNDRGQSDLPNIAKFIRQQGFAPRLVMCSPAARTRATYDGIKQALPDHELQMVDEFYHGGVNNYLDHVKNAGVSGDIMLIGHNPSCELLANCLYGDGEAKALEDIAWKFPTGAIAVIQFGIDDWSKIEAKSGYLECFALPRELPHQIG